MQPCTRARRSAPKAATDATECREEICFMFMLWRYCQDNCLSSRSRKVTGFSALAAPSLFP